MECAAATYRGSAAPATLHQMTIGDPEELPHPGCVRAVMERLPAFSAALVGALVTLSNGAGAQAAPTAGPPRDSLVREFRGAYQRGFEQSWFVPCTAPADDAMWWVTLTDQALLQRDSLLAVLKGPATDGLAVRWRGTVGPRMPAGMMGRGTRYILVTEILEVRPLPSTGGCDPDTKA